MERALSISPNPVHIRNKPKLAKYGRMAAVQLLERDGSWANFLLHVTRIWLRSITGLRIIGLSGSWYEEGFQRARIASPSCGAACEGCRVAAPTRKGVVHVKVMVRFV